MRTIALEDGSPVAVHHSQVVKGLHDSIVVTILVDQRRFKSGPKNGPSLFEPTCTISELLAFTSWNCPIYTI